MAPNPLFVPDLTTLKAELRLTGVAENTDAQTILESAVLQVRAGFYSRIPAARMTFLLAITPAAEPSTNDQILRAIGSLCEALWVRYVLLGKLPMLFMDNSGGDQEFVNQEGIFRSITPERLDRQKQADLTQIEEWLALLAGDVELGDAPLTQVHIQSDQLPRVFPLGTLIGENQRLWGDPTRELR